MKLRLVLDTIPLNRFRVCSQGTTAGAVGLPERTLAWKVRRRRFLDREKKMRVFSVYLGMWSKPVFILKNETDETEINNYDINFQL